MTDDDGVLRLALRDHQLQRTRERRERNKLYDFRWHFRHGINRRRLAKLVTWPLVTWYAVQLPRVWFTWCDSMQFNLTLFPVCVTRRNHKNTGAREANTKKDGLTLQDCRATTNELWSAHFDVALEFQTFKNCTLPAVIRTQYVSAKEWPLNWCECANYLNYLVKRLCLHPY